MSADKSMRGALGSLSRVMSVRVRGEAKFSLAVARRVQRRCGECRSRAKGEAAAAAAAWEGRGVLMACRVAESVAMLLGAGEGGETRKGREKLAPAARAGRGTL